MKNKPVHIIGGGLAGCEAAWQLVKADIPVIIHEMRPSKNTDAHKTDCLAELVCSNSLRSDDAEYNAVGLMHEELRKCDSLILVSADKHRVPAGGALAVDREGFALEIQERLKNHPLVTISREEITKLPPEDQTTIIATGPLTSEPLANAIKDFTGEDSLSFFDAIAPIVYKDSIDFSKAWYQSRYDKGDSTDYINCPMNKEQYYAFIEALIEGEKIEFHEWEKKTQYFEGCLPIEVMAERGKDTLAFGPMKPVGLTNQHEPTIKPFAIIQLRQDNALDTLRNIVGFQTKLKHGEQKRIFRTIPGLEKAEFAKLGGIHRNSFINSPVLLDEHLRLKARPSITFAGQITGCEGYVESTAAGFLAGKFVAAQLSDKSISPPPNTTAMGAMLNHIISGIDEKSFQPMNINFGLFPPPPPLPKREDGKKQRKLKGRDRKKAYTERAVIDFNEWLGIQKC